MTKIVVNTIRSQTGVTSVTFYDTITANGNKQWLDRFGIIKANSNQILSNATIPSGTNALSVGKLTVGDGCTVTVRGDWRII